MAVICRRLTGPIPERTNESIPKNWESGAFRSRVREQARGVDSDDHSRVTDRIPLAHGGRIGLHPGQDQVYPGMIVTGLLPAGMEWPPTARPATQPASGIRRQRSFLQ